MRGSIRSRSKDSWEITVDIGRDPVSGKRLRHFACIKGAKKDAQKRLHELLLEVERGTYIEQPKQLTLANWLQRWLDSYGASNLSPKTKESYQQELDCHIIPSLGSIRLAELRPHHIQGYIAKALSEGLRHSVGGLSHRTVQYHYTILNKALGDAVKMGIIAVNPSRAISRPRIIRREIPTYESNDLSRLLAAIQESPYRLFFLMLLFSGVRRGEALSLRWCDFNEDFTRIRIVRSLCKLKTGDYIFKAPKNGRGRQVDLPPFLTEILGRHRVEREAEAALLGRPFADSELVFSLSNGAPISASTLGHAFNGLLKKAAIGHLRLHDLRHLNASMLLQAGVHPKVVSERLGHSSVAITLDVYSHVAPTIQKAAAQRLEEVIDPAILKMLVNPGLSPDREKKCRQNVGKSSKVEDQEKVAISGGEGGI